MPHLSEYEVETRFLDRLESLGYLQGFEVSQKSVSATAFPDRTGEASTGPVPAEHSASPQRHCSLTNLQLIPVDDPEGSLFAGPVP